MNAQKIIEVLKRTSEKAAELAATGVGDPELARKSADMLAMAFMEVEKAAQEGTRVSVRDGTGTKEIGFGTLVGFVTVYAKREGDSLQSLRCAEEPFEGAAEIHDNPKFLMDDGSVRYGCQVWWEPAEEEPATRAS